jgi:hypothetical protein
MDENVSLVKRRNFALTFAHISSIDPDVNEKFVDDDKAVFNLSR